MIYHKPSTYQHLSALKLLNCALGAGCFALLPDAGGEEKSSKSISAHRPLFALLPLVVVRWFFFVPRIGWALQLEGLDRISEMPRLLRYVIC